jgi:hypothetical protein
MNGAHFAEALAMFDQVLASALPEGADGTSVVLHAHMARGTARAMLRDLQVVQQAHHIPNPNVNQTQVNACAHGARHRTRHAKGPAGRTAGPPYS